MVKNSRTGLMVGVALLAGVAAGAVGMMSLRGGDGPYAASPAPATRSLGAASASTAFVAAVAGNCEMNPVLPSAGSGDGSESLQQKPGTAGSSEVASLILSGKEASASGRQRDAEIDFLNACRNAAQLQDGDPIPLADAMYQLGRHYANVAALGGSKNKDLFQRAERLYSASLEAYRARYGEDSEKTKFAREGLVTVQQATGGKAPTAIAKARPPAPAAAPSAPAANVATAPASAPLAAAPAPAPVAAVPAAAPVPVLAAPASPPPSVAKAEAPRTAASSSPVVAAPRRRAPVHRQEQGTPPSDVAATPRSAPATAEARSIPRVELAPAPMDERPRVQPRRSAPAENARDEGEVAVDAPPPPPRPRSAPSSPRESQQDAAPADTGTAGGAPTAEGSPGTP
jgi:hypothetical protein